MAAAGPSPAVELAAVGRRLDEARQRHAQAEERLAAAERDGPSWRRVVHRPNAELLLARHEATHATAEAADLKTAYDAVARQAAARDAYLKDHAEEVARLERVERAAESALAARMRRIGAEPPAYIIDKLGHVPSSGAARNAWWSAAKSIET